MSVSQVDLSGGCEFYVAGPDGESRPCDAPAEERSVSDGDGAPVQVALCDEHFDYVSDRANAHYWFIDRAGKGARVLMRLGGRPT